MVTWRSYHGSHESTEWDQQPAVRWQPQSSGHSRHVSEETFIPPVVITGWVHLESVDPQQPWDGVKVHLGHLGNNRNYVVDLVRPDNHMVISREYGWRHYDDLDGSRRTDALNLTQHGVYVFRIDWQPEFIRAEVANEIATVAVEAQIKRVSEQGRSEGSHVPVIPFGSVGVRLDHITALGQLQVREMS